MNELVNQAVIHLFIGFALGLVNLIIRYFLPSVPRVISISYWGLRQRVFIIAYLIALALELITSPLFRSYLTSVYVELAWSPYQALFIVLGILLMDGVVAVWNGVARGFTAGRKQIAEVGHRTAEEIHQHGIGQTPEEQAVRRSALTQSEAQANAERQKRLDDHLKDY